MPRVLRIINRLNLGGPTFNAAYLTKYLEPEFETVLLSGMKDETEASSEFILDNLGIRPIYIPEMKREIDPFNDITAFKALKKVIKEFKPDIVHTHAAKAGTVGRLAAHSCKVPVVLHTFHGHVFHSYFSPLKTKLFIQIERHLAKKSNAIIAISEKQKQELSETYKICSADKIRIVPLGFDLTRFKESKEEKRKNFRAKYNIDEDEIVISIIGRLVPIKNHFLFLEGIKHLISNSPKKIRAFIVGDGESRMLIEEKVSGLGLTMCDALKSNHKANITFTSWIKEIDVVNAGSDIIALTSNNEGTPVSLIEAQASCKPIISTRVGGIENITTPETAILVSAGDIVAFSENLVKLVNDDLYRNLIGSKGWELVGEKYHYTRLVSDMQNLYNELLNKQSN